MLLNEFIYFNTTNADPEKYDRYNPLDDSSVIKSSDLRKTRLTFKMLKELRLAGEAREKEYKEEMGLVRKMYAVPPPQPT